LAEKLNYNFIDLDVFISEKNNCKLQDFIEKNGWENFREEEYNCLKEILQNNSGYPQGVPLQNFL
jgi:shikimate kinase